MIRARPATGNSGIAHSLPGSHQLIPPGCEHWFEHFPVGRITREISRSVTNPRHAVLLTAMCGTSGQRAHCRTDRVIAIESTTAETWDAIDWDAPRLLAVGEVWLRDRLKIHREFCERLRKMPAEWLRRYCGRLKLPLPVPIEKREVRVAILGNLERIEIPSAPTTEINDRKSAIRRQLVDLDAAAQKWPGWSPREVIDKLSQMLIADMCDDLEKRAAARRLARKQQSAPSPPAEESRSNAVAPPSAGGKFRLRVVGDSRSA